MPTSAPHAEVPAGFLQGARVLVVDDDVALLTAVAKSLRLHGARVLGAGGVSEAIRLLTAG